jgi:hypothetical protein
MSLLARRWIGLPNVQQMPFDCPVTIPIRIADFANSLAGADLGRP